MLSALPFLSFSFALLIVAPLYGPYTSDIRFPVLWAALFVASLIAAAIAWLIGSDQG